MEATPWLALRRNVTWLRGERTHVVSSRMQSELVAELKALEFKTYELNGHEVAGEVGFFAETARALGFPAYFGRNWNAFIDCLRGLEDRPDRRVAILWHDADCSVTADLQTVFDAVSCFESVAIELASGELPVQVELFLIGNVAGFGGRQFGDMEPP